MKRNLSLDMLRIMAMFMILVLHSVVFLDKSSCVTFNECLLYDTEIALCRSGVNVFVLLTGFFIHGEMQNFRKVYALFASVLFFNIALLPVTHVVSGGVTLHTIIMCLSPFKYWFINCYVGLVLLSPYIIVGIKNMSNETFDMLVLVFTAINLLFGRLVGTADGFSLIWFVNLFLIGQRLKKMSAQYHIRYILMVLVASIILYVFGSLVLLNIHGNADTYNVGIFGVYSNIFSLAISVCLFLLFRQCTVRSLYNKFISVFAQSAFAVYLISENFNVKPVIWSVWNSFLSATNVGGSVIITFLMQIAYCSLLFVACVIIDNLRQMIFKVCNIYNFTVFLDKHTNVLLDRAIRIIRKDETT